MLYRGAPLAGPSEGIAVVFQTFALYPWLTVLENVEFGLDALGLSLDEARRRAMSAIDLIGLDGFQSAFPRELSGGMRQRVGSGAGHYRNHARSGRIHVAHAAPVCVDVGNAPAGARQWGNRTRR